MRDAVFRKLRTMMGCAIFALAIANPSLASIVVDSDVDAPAKVVNGQPVCAAQIGAELHCTLRAAVQVANYNAGYTKIELKRGTTYLLSLPSRSGSPPGESGALTIGPVTFAATVVEIVAAGEGDSAAVITRTADFDDSMFHVTGNGTTAGGQLELTGVRLVGNMEPGAGLGEAGGAIHCDGGSILSATDSSFEGNASKGRGGAIALEGGCLARFERTGFDGNRSGSRGGAIDATDSSVIANAVSFVGNGVTQPGAEGSAIAVLASRDPAADGIFIANSTIYGNVSGSSVVYSSSLPWLITRNVSAIGNHASAIFRIQDTSAQLANSVIADNGDAESLELLGSSFQLQSLGHNRLWRLAYSAVDGGSAHLIDSDELLFAGSLLEINPATDWPGIVAIPTADSPLVGQGGGEIVADGLVYPLCSEFDANLASRKSIGRCDIGAANFVDHVFGDGFELLHAMEPLQQ